LDGDVKCGHVEGLEHDLGHLLAIGLRVTRSFGQHDGVLLRRNPEFVVEGVVPDLLHVVPVGNNAMLDGILQCEDTTLRLSFVAVNV